MRASRSPQSARAVEQAVRVSYGRLVAILAARWRDVAAAEDALATALEKALSHWPRDGVPQSPEAWLMRVAQRGLLDAARKDAAQKRHEDVLRSLEELRLAAASAGVQDSDRIPDRRLGPMFVCAHPAIDEGVRAPLMLQAVLGLDVAAIARAFQIGATAMAQRLVRAKSKIRDARIAFSLPPKEEWAGRMGSVLDAIYAAFGVGWDEVGATTDSGALAQEAIWLSRVLVAIAPEEPEPQGLLALMLYADARACARRDRNGRFVRLSDQDTALWDKERMDEADRWLRAAAAFGQLGRFQLEAAIQSVHVARSQSGATDWPALLELYDGLWALYPVLSTAIGRAAALMNAGRIKAALEALAELDEAAVRDYQPFWAVLGEVHRAGGDRKSAEAAFARAALLTNDDAVRAYLAHRLDG